MKTALIHWFYMGGYYSYLWPAYILVIISLIGHLISIRYYGKMIKKRLIFWFDNLVDERCKKE